MLSALVPSERYNLFVRLAGFFVPFGISLAVVGGIIVYAAGQPGKPETPYIVAEVRHPVSDEMLLAAKAMSQKASPFFKVKDIHGINVQIGGQGKKPQFVYFILDGCPCSIDVQPLFNRMYQRYKDKVDFIGVINVDKAKAIDYAGANTVLHPVVSDQALDIIKAFHAKQSTYHLVIRPNGTIEKLWPGYSQATLYELNTVLAKLTRTKEEPFDAAYATKKPASGCFFY